MNHILHKTLAICNHKHYIITQTIFLLCEQHDSHTNQHTQLAYFKYQLPLNRTVPPESFRRALQRLYKHHNQSSTVNNFCVTHTHTRTQERVVVFDKKIYIYIF